jgi:hypothetical protein
MVDIGGDGTTTVRKLEGFQIGLLAKGSRFTASRAPSLDLLMVISNGALCFPGHDVNSIADRLACAYDQPLSHFHAPSSVDICHVRNTQRTGEYALEDRDDASTARLTTLELPINEELEGSLLALHDTGSQEDE